LAERSGWEYGGPIAGHLIGIFPYEKISRDKVTLYVHPKNHNQMRLPDASGRKRHWILEIHFVDRAREIGGFYEELLELLRPHFHTTFSKDFRTPAGEKYRCGY
jgi:Xaa-Pro dipeptidase